MPPVPKRAKGQDAVSVQRPRKPSHARATARSRSQAEEVALQTFELAAHFDIPLPADAHVIGEPIAVTKIHAGLPRVGLRATCQRNGSVYEVSLADIVFSPGSAGAELVARYRAWLGFDGEEVERSTQAVRPHKITSDDIAIGSPIELVVLASKSNALRCRLLGTAREVTLRTAVRDEVPGSIITVTPTTQWMHARHPYIAGGVERTRFDIRALCLTPLALRDEGEWDPENEHWGEEGEPLDRRTTSVIARGKRPMFEMEQVIPGQDPDDFDSDPIVEAAERNNGGDYTAAREILMNLLAQDLRCLDAHAHLGNFEFEHRPKQALRHYEVGTSIGALSLGADFDGVLAWGLIDNRPFLRCLYGTGICAWRLGDRRGAVAVFEKMLLLNPGDHQGVRFNLAAIEAGETWEEALGDEI
jgi:hypothetical protein